MNKPPASYNPFDPEIIESPWEFFAALRREAPLYELPNKAYYLISRYEDVMKAVMDTETFSSNLVAILLQDSAEDAPHFFNLVNRDNTTDPNPDTLQSADALAIADPPVHTRQRRVSNRAFTPRKVATMEGDISLLARQLIEPILAQGHSNWMQDVAIPLPMTIIVRLLGLPTEDIPQLKIWSDHSIALLNGINTTEEFMEHGLQAAEMIEYLAKQYDLARANPREDVISHLAMESEQNSDSLSRNEVVSILTQLLTAGNETTTSLIGSAVMLMLQTPGLQEQLRAHPEKIETFVEEVLRIESPFHGHFRLVKKDTEIGGQPLPAGSRVMLLWSSANRDEQAFPCTDSLDLNRAKPRAHLSFGYGIHHCIGAALARSEVRITLETLLARTRQISLSAENDFRHVPSLMVRCLRRLDLQLEPA